MALGAGPEQCVAQAPAPESLAAPRGASRALALTRPLPHTLLRRMRRHGGDPARGGLLP
jgi:hypothetical protein